MINTGDWVGRRVLVTGARGFIASQLCQRLASERALTYGVSRVPVPKVPGVECLVADFAEIGVADRVLQQVKPEVVFHLAGHVVGDQQLTQVWPTFAANLATTVHLLTAAAMVGDCRVVLAGSMQEPQDPGLADPPCSPYAASKWAATGYARMFHALYSLPVVIARLFMVYGPGQWDSAKVLPYAILSLLTETPPRIGSGARELDWIYVDDAIDALLVLAASSHASAVPIDVGTGTLTSVRGIIERVAAIIGSDVQPVYGAVADRPFERSRTANVEETRRLTGWQPSRTLSDGLATTIEWHRTRLAAGVNPR